MAGLGWARLHRDRGAATRARVGVNARRTRESKENVASEHGRDVSCILRVFDARRDALLRV